MPLFRPVPFDGGGGGGGGGNCGVFAGGSSSGTDQSDYKTI